jgi:hypothetical protein
MLEDALGVSGFVGSTRYIPEVPYTDIVAPISPEPVRAAMAGIRCTSRETWPFGDSAAISLALTAQHLIAFKMKVVANTIPATSIRGSLRQT